MLAAQARDRVKPTPATRRPVSGPMEKAKPAAAASEGRVLGKIGPEPEEREWLERLGRVKSAVAAGASPVHAKPTPRPVNSELRPKSLPAPSTAAKTAGRASLPPPRAVDNVKPLAEKREKDSSLAALSLSMRLVREESYGRVAAPPPPPPPSPRRVQGFPKRLRHAADPTDYDVQIIASYAPPPVPAHLVPRGRVVIVPPDPGFTMLNVERPKRRITPYVIALSALMAVAVVATWLGASREAPAHHAEPSVATTVTAAPASALPSIASSAEPMPIATSTVPAPVSAEPAMAKPAEASTTPSMPLHSSVLAAFSTSSSTHSVKPTAHVAHPAKHARAHHRSHRTRRHHAHR